MRGLADDAIRERFTDLTEAAAKGLLDHWVETPRGRLVLIIALDQFSRSVWRGTPAAFGRRGAGATAFELSPRGGPKSPGLRGHREVRAAPSPQCRAGTGLHACGRGLPRCRRVSARAQISSHQGGDRRDAGKARTRGRIRNRRHCHTASSIRKSGLSRKRTRKASQWICGFLFARLNLLATVNADFGEPAYPSSRIAEIAASAQAKPTIA